MKAFKFILLAFSVLVSACATVESRERAAQKLECAIYVETVIKMREEARLADPVMLSDCPVDNRLSPNKIAPRLNAPSLPPEISQRVYQNFLDRRMPKDIASSIRTSIAFEKLVNLRSLVANGNSS